MARPRQDEMGFVTVGRFPGVAVSHTDGRFGTARCSWRSPGQGGLGEVLLARSDGVAMS